MCGADFNVAGGLPGENGSTTTALVISAWSASNWTSFAHKMFHRIYPETDCFVLRKVVWEKGQTLIELCFTSSGFSSSTRENVLTNPLCNVLISSAGSVGREGKERLWPKHQSIVCILQKRGMLLMGSGKHTNLQNNRVILKHYIQDFAFALVRKWSQDALRFKVPNLCLSLFVLLSWTSSGLSIINVPVMFPDMFALYSSVVEHK